MKKLDHTEWLNRIIPKFYLKMKFIILFLTVILFQAQANSGYSQSKKISMELKEVNYLQVFEEIESKTDFNFFYKNEDIDENKKISIRVKNKKVETILKDMFQDTDISFTLLNKQIIIQKHPDDDMDKNIMNISTKNVEAPAKTEEVLIKGKVTDENGDPLPGASVAVKETNIGVSTDMEGAFSLTVPDGTTTLVISFVGYKTLEVEIGGRQFLDIQLEADIASLSEVVVVGYGTVKKEDLTGSVGVVKVENITNQAPTVNLDHALQGQIAGVYVSAATGQPGAAARVRIRGTTSLFGSNQPLYVIDGIPVVPNSNIPVGGSEGGNLGSSFNDQGISTPLGNINNADIESISVLKDASAAAIYGSRAANGVIIINTKRGAYGSTPKFSADYSISTQNPRTLEVLNAAQFREIWTTAVENSSVTNTFTQSVLDGSYFGDADTNWEDEVSPPANPITSNFNMNILGGTENTRYNISLGINSQDGVYEGSGFDRYTFNLNLDTDVNDIWTFGSKLNISYTDQEFPDAALTQEMYNYRPDVPVFDSLGNFGFSSTYNFENPVALSKAKNSNKTLLLLGSFFAQLRLAEGLNLKTSFALQYNDGNQQSFYPTFTFTGGWRRFGGGTEGNGFAQESRSRSTSTIWRNTLTFNKSFNNHTVNALLVAEFQKDNSSFTKVWGEGFSNDVLTNISSATVFTEASGSRNFSGLASYIGRVNYNYADKYFATFTARVDGSSKFGAGNQYAFFPAVAAAWKISNEPFLVNNSFIDELKLRVSAGTTGQQDFGPYVWRTLYSTFDYADAPSVISTQLGNNKLKWETTDQFDIGLDFSLLKGRVSGTFNYYTKITNDALFFAKPPGSVGTVNNTTVVANVGNTKNNGIELELTGNLIKTGDFSWDISFNITKNTNELTKISDDFKDENGFLTSFPGGGRLKEGSPIGLIYGYVSEGIFQTQDEIAALNTGSETGIYQNGNTAPGDFKFRDISGPDGVPDGRITNLDQQIIGDTQPDFFGGINSTWSYKGFSLSTLFTYSIGNDLYAFGLANNNSFFSTLFGENRTTDVLNAWTPENTNTNIARVVYRDPNFNNRRSSQYVYDASYIRLRTLNLSYAFSNNLLHKTGFVNSASLFVTAQNLLTITNYPGADPETSSRFNNDISAGNDVNRFPVAKVYTIGVRIGF